MTTFGDELRYFMIRYQIKSNVLAEKLGIAASNLSDILRGKRKMKKETFKKLLEVLDASEKERFELEKAYNLDKIDEKIATYYQELEQEIRDIKMVIETLNKFKKI